MPSSLSVRPLGSPKNVMPQLHCPRCQRANPEEAGFCHFDGTPLQLVPGQPAKPHGQLPHDFVFPSGRTCRSFDELVQTCQQEWAEARSLLQQGVFGQFLAGAGRTDLARAARKAQDHPDPDVGLHIFLSGLPAKKIEGPKLDLKPRRLALGAVRAGEVKPIKLTVVNVGKGLLHGTLTVSAGGDWLKLDTPDPDLDPQGNSHCTLKTAREQLVMLRADTRYLAAKQHFSGKLTVITNGGIVEVPVTLDLVAMPFPKAPFAGAATPRDLAEKMRAQPKAAVPLLESGDIARWFTANGWVYPVPIATAHGVAAVQQFFEGMGLSKPPPLQLSETEASYLCVPPEVIQGQVTLYTGVKKWVYANVEADVPWLRVTTPTVSGPQQAVIAYEIDSTLMDGGRIHEGNIQILANAGQQLAVRLFVDVREPQVPFTRRLFRPFFAGALLFLLIRLLLAGPADVYARVLTAPPPAGSFDSWLESPLRNTEVATPFLKNFVLTTWWVGAVVGAVVLWQRGSRLSDVFCGAVAGGVAGLLGSATFACLMPVLDGLPRLLWYGMGIAVRRGSLTQQVWLWTPLWIAVAAGCWALVGGSAGFLLRLAGQRGIQILAGAGSPLAWAARLVGMDGVASFFALSG
jgi:hypothetical protein